MRGEEAMLEVRVARAMKAALDAEGLDFSRPLSESPLDVEAVRRAFERFHRENRELIAQVREWYLATHPPLRAEPSEADQVCLAAFFAERGYWWEHIG
jgi:hypothetical protein